MGYRIVQVAIWISYVTTFAIANAQDIDPSINIGNQVDQNVVDTLIAPGATPVNITEARQKSAASLQLTPWSTPTTKNGYLSPYSGYATSVAPLTVSVLAQQGFSSKDSFTGMGVTTSYTSQVGLDLATCYGTDIQPFLSYQHASRDLIGTTTYRSDAYGGSLNLTQRIFPLAAITDKQPKAVYNFSGGDTTPIDATQSLSNGNGYIGDTKYVKDVYPNCDINLGLNLGLNAPSITTLKKTTWVASNQNMYSVAPSVVFDLFLRPVLADGIPRPRYLPNSISIVPTYNDTMTMVDNGTSGSNGTLAIQERNAYVFAIHPPTDPPVDKFNRKPTDLVPHASETIQIIETNTLLHDTNQEPTTASPGPIPYQNWAKFGLAIAYTNKNVNLKVEYTYEAFNTMYDTQNVVASLSCKF